jgi:hypothetical protein
VKIITWPSVSIEEKRKSRGRKRPGDVGRPDPTAAAYEVVTPECASAY